MNHQIRAPKLRIIVEDGEAIEMVGVLTREEALALAEERGLDLIEIAPNADPPVAKILDFGKFKYRESKKAAKARKSHHNIQVKEIRLRPKTEEHDFQVKLRNAMKFLEKGDRVMVNMMFKGREMAYVDRGMELMKRFVTECGELAEVEQAPKSMGRKLIMSLIPKKKK